MNSAWSCWQALQQVCLRFYFSRAFASPLERSGGGPVWHISRQPLELGLSCSGVVRPEFSKSLSANMLLTPLVSESTRISGTTPRFAYSVIGSKASQLEAGPTLQLCRQLRLF